MRRPRTCARRQPRKRAATRRRPGLPGAATPLSGLCYGLFLGTAFSVPFGFRVAGLHVLVSTLAALAAYLAVIALQGLVLSVAGPRLFTRVAPLL